MQDLSTWRVRETTQGPDRQFYHFKRGKDYLPVVLADPEVEGTLSRLGLVSAKLLLFYEDTIHTRQTKRRPRPFQQICLTQNL